MKTNVIMGATSAIAAALVEKLAAAGEDLFLVGRDEKKLAAVAADAEMRGAVRVRTRRMDLANLDEAGAADFWREAGGLESVVIAAGILSVEDGDLAAWRREVEVNFTGTAFLARQAVERMAEQPGGGVLQVIGSVAGDRGRQSNGFYGAQKAALETYIAALEHRAALLNKEVKVLLVKPGLVRSPMTAGIADSPLFSEPEAVASAMAKTLQKRKGGTIYAPWWWRGVMLVIKCVPGFVFKKTKL